MMVRALGRCRHAYEQRLVLASLLADPPGWLGLRADPRRAARRFGLDPAAVPAMGPLEFAARALGSMLQAAASDPTRRLCIDHAELPAAAWTRAAPHFGFETGTAAIELMSEESVFDAKDPARRPFADEPGRRSVTDEIREAARRFAQPAYQSLNS